MSQDKLIGCATIEKARAVFESATTSITKASIMTAIDRGMTATNRILAKLVEDGEIIRTVGTDARGNFMTVFHKAGRQLVPPPGSGFKERTRVRIGGAGNTDQPHQKTVKAMQANMDRPWYIRCLFGDGPARSHNAVA